MDWTGLKLNKQQQTALCQCSFNYTYTQHQNEREVKIYYRWSSSLLGTRIVGAELKNGKRTCANYIERRDLYKKRIIFKNLKRQKWFEIHKIIPVRIVFEKQTNE